MPARESGRPPTEQELVERLEEIEDQPLVPFHRMSDWGDDGRIQPTAPVSSPFIRHRERLDLG